jgi:hypothetical protein
MRDKIKHANLKTVFWIKWHVATLLTIFLLLSYLSPVYENQTFQHIHVETFFLLEGLSVFFLPFTFSTQQPYIYRTFYHAMLPLYLGYKAFFLQIEKFFKMQYTNTTDDNICFKRDHIRGTQLEDFLRRIRDKWRELNRL